MGECEASIPIRSDQLHFIFLSGRRMTSATAAAAAAAAALPLHFSLASALPITIPKLAAYSVVVRFSFFLLLLFLPYICKFLKLVLEIGVQSKEGNFHIQGKWVLDFAGCWAYKWSKACGLLCLCSYFKRTRARCPLFFVFFTLFPNLDLYLYLYF